jgi:hypothetical protein
MDRKNAMAAVMLNETKRGEKSQGYIEILRFAQNDQCAAHFLSMSELIFKTALSLLE